MIFSCCHSSTALMAFLPQIVPQERFALRAGSKPLTLALSPEGRGDRCRVGQYRVPITEQTPSPLWGEGWGEGAAP